MDDANKNIPINTPRPCFLMEEEQQAKEEDISAVEALVALSTPTPALSPIPTSIPAEKIEDGGDDDDDDDADDDGEYSENENVSTTTVSPIPIPLPPQQPDCDFDDIKSPFNTPNISIAESLPTLTDKDLFLLPRQISINNDNLFPIPSVQQELPIENSILFSTPPPQQQQTSIFPPSDISEILNHSTPIIPPYVANKNDSYRKGGKNVNLMRELYESDLVNEQSVKRKRREEEEVDDEGNDDDDYDDDERKKPKSELRQTTKNNRRFHRTLYLKKRSYS